MCGKDGGRFWLGIIIVILCIASVIALRIEGGKTWEQVLWSGIGFYHLVVALNRRHCRFWLRVIRSALIDP